MKINTIYIENNTPDLMSSLLLDDLVHVLKTKYHISDKDIHRETMSIANTKCELTLAVSVLTSIATGIISAAIWDYIKGVYAHRGGENINKEWKLSLTIERPLQVTVKENLDTNTIEVEIVEQ